MFKRIIKLKEKINALEERVKDLEKRIEEENNMTSKTLLDIRSDLIQFYKYIDKK